MITPIQIFRLAFESVQLNQAAALSVVFFFVAAIVVALYVRVIPSSAEEA
jgi:multiple sugar transport system permease protein